MIMIGINVREDAYSGIPPGRPKGGLASPRGAANECERGSSSIAEPRERVEGAFEQRHLEPDLEQDEKAGVDAKPHDGAPQPCVLAEPGHEQRDVDGGGD